MITRDSIQEFLEIRPPSQLISVQYEDRLGSIEEIVQILGGTPKKSSMNTIHFSPEMKIAVKHVKHVRKTSKHARKAIKHVKEQEKAINRLGN